MARLFDNPLASGRLREFWSQRWNRPFVEMNRVLWLPELAKLGLTRAQGVLAAFLLSGLLHEAAISFPAHGGLGRADRLLSTAGLVNADGGRMDGRIAWLVPPPVDLDLAFATPASSAFSRLFHHVFLEPLASAITALPLFRDQPTLLRFLLTAAGWGHLLVLAGGLQVPLAFGLAARSSFGCVRSIANCSGSITLHRLLYRHLRSRHLAAARGDAGGRAGRFNDVDDHRYLLDRAPDRRRRRLRTRRLAGGSAV